MSPQQDLLLVIHNEVHSRALCKNEAQSKAWCKAWCKHEAQSKALCKPAAPPKDLPVHCLQ
jgi:hypothetical protein